MPVFLVCLGCSPGEGAGDRALGAHPSEPVDTTARTASGGRCPGSDFDAFFSAFAEDPALQEAWTAFPLESLHLADADPEPREQVDSISRAEAKFPLVPSRSERARDSREVTVEDLPEGHKRVTIAQPDTDWVLHYTFTPAEGCWRLVRIEDWSL